MTTTQPETVEFWGTVTIHEGQLERYRAFLYSHTEIVETHHVTDIRGNRLYVLKLRTTADGFDRARYLMQYQADRLASGMMGLFIHESNLVKADDHLKTLLRHMEPVVG